MSGVNWTTEDLAARPIIHGLTCPKRTHTKASGYLHDHNDDRPYDVDGVMYCGRCHEYLEGKLIPEKLEPLAKPYSPMRRSKYGVDTSEAGKAKRTVDGILFDSEREAQHYRELHIAEQAGAIRDLKLQPRFLLQEAYEKDGKKVRMIEFVADFSFIEGGRQRVIDVKGVRTTVFRLKEKMFHYHYPLLTLELWR